MPLWNWIPNRNPPEEPEPEELLKRAERRVMDFEVENLKAIFFELYKKHYRTTYIRIGSTPASITSLKRIIALCRLKGWSVRDYVQYNFTWFAEHSRHRPQPNHLCGEKAEMRYGDFLGQEEYGGDASKRNEEVERIEASKQRINRMRATNTLPHQIEEKAVQYARKKAQEAVVDLSQPINGVPGFVQRTMTPQKKEELIREKIFYREKANYIKKWNKQNGNTVHTRHVSRV